MKNKILKQFLIWLFGPLSIFIACFICACSQQPSNGGIDEKTPIPTKYYNEIIRVDYKRKKSRRSSSGSRRSSSSSSSDSEDDGDDEDDSVSGVEISQLNQISSLMEAGNYEEASRLSRGVSPQLSALIEAGDYTGASLLLTQILANL